MRLLVVSMGIALAAACGTSQRGTAVGTSMDGGDGDGAPRQAVVTILVTEEPPPDAAAE